VKKDLEILKKREKEQKMVATGKKGSRGSKKGEGKKNATEWPYKRTAV
jgi:hypothetical protein